LADQEAPPSPDKPWKVAELSGIGGGRSVYRHRIPAIRASSFGPGGRSHLVQQVTTSGAAICRHIHPREVDRLFHSATVKIEWGEQDTRRCERQGSSAPPDLILPILDGIAKFCRPACPMVPASISDIISNDDVRAYRGHLAMAYTDFQHAQRKGLTTVEPGSDPPARPGRAGQTRQPEGGLVFHTDLPMAFYLGKYWITQDIDDIVPAAHIEGGHTIAKAVFAIVANGFPDEELVASLSGAGVPSKDTPTPGVLFVATNHKKATSHHHLVHKMYAGEIKEGRMLQYGVDQTPVFVGPSNTSPTGATVKKDREGAIDKKKEG
jgi:hypothetical protein